LEKPKAWEMKGKSVKSDMKREKERVSHDRFIMGHVLAGGSISLLLLENCKKKRKTKRTYKIVFRNQT
jgi:hypothetical protein